MLGKVIEKLNILATKLTVVREQFHKLKNFIKKLLGIESLSSYGLSTDSSIILKSIPQAWPKIGSVFKAESPCEYNVVSVDTSSKVVTVARKDDETKTYRFNIETFEELMVPVDKEENYPL